ncbi:MAG: 3-oxoacyl-[acyl-carrier-protein] reductase [Nitrospirae bacterium]|nr:3-oxoacyl-[acyl-carrier-protein] reductase [Nitrospirota bacterium]
MSGLTGKVALITGGAQGIGLAIATALHQAGAVVVVGDLDEAKAKEAAAGLGGEASSIRLNVADEQDVKQAVAQLIAERQRIDILVCNAGITRDGLLLRMKPEDWDAVLAVNLHGTFYCIKQVLPAMTKQRYGRIVTISSIVGVMGNAGQANYAASKAAVIGLTKSVAREYAGRNVTANAVAPGFIDTAMTQKLPDSVKQQLRDQIPLARLGTPQDIAAAVKFLVSDDAAYITGQVLHVNGGMWMG